MARRNFMFREMRLNGRVKEKDIKAEFAAARQSMIDDITFFINLGVRVERVTEEDGETYIVDRDRRHTRSKKSRDRLERQKKLAVSRLATGVIVGFPKEVEEIPRDNGFELCYHQEAILKMLSEGNSVSTNNVKRAEISRLLRSLWLSAHRRVAIDAGTTNDPTVSFISRLMLPTPFGTLSNLSVCTNSRGMFQVLGSPEVDAKVIMIGGEQVGKTESVAGTYAELFVRNSGLLHFGVSLIGATSIDMSKDRMTGMRCCSHSHEESVLKNTLLEKSSLRIVCVDDSKFQENPMTESFHFCSIHRDQIDMIITSKPDPSNPRFKTESYEKYLSDLKEFVKRIEE